MILNVFLLSIVTHANEMNLEDVSKDIEEIIAYIDLNYYKEINRDDLITGAYNGIFETLDNHSTYIDPQTYEAVMQHLHGNYIGIGIIVEETTDGILIKNTYGNSPAEAGGIEAGDVVLTVNGISVKSIGYNKALDLLLGEIESEVIVSVRKKGSNNIEVMKLIRELVDLESVEYKIIDEHVGYIRIIEFSQGVSDEISKALATFDEQKIDRIIIDVRNNPGGLIDEVIKVLNQFVESGNLLIEVQSKNINSKIIAEEAGRKNKLVVLTNSKSASASEILAGNLRYYNQARLLGTKTYGKGTVQEIINLKQGKHGAYKVTVGEYILPGGQKINELGLQPDVYVENYDDLDFDMIQSFAPMSENKDYRAGEIGLNIFGMEQRLSAMGYKINIDGVFDGESQRELIEFQKKYGIKGDGILNQETIQQLDVYFQKANMILDHDYQLEKALEIFEIGRER